MFQRSLSTEIVLVQKQLKAAVFEFWMWVDFQGKILA